MQRFKANVFLVGALMSGMGLLMFSMGTPRRVPAGAARLHFACDAYANFNPSCFRACQAANAAWDVAQDCANSVGFFGNCDAEIAAYNHAASALDACIDPIGHEQQRRQAFKARFSRKK